jgi:signal transduction histidine kinase
MAALALRPHMAQDEYSARFRRLDFVLMMVWWMYLYVFAVMAWQYVAPDISAYNNDLNLLYMIEKIAFLVALVVACLNSQGSWKTLYANLFGASLMYSLSSYLANWAIDQKAYYSGSLYDIPLVASMAWITWIGLSPHEEVAPAKARAGSTAQGVWLARAGMIAVFSLPLFAGWALLQPNIPPRVRSFRLALTLIAALFMGILIFVRQHLLDRELLRLLAQSRESFANLKRLQAQITESEKLASVGQLVGGAAHELNNPIAAMMGYCDLLVDTTLSPEQQVFAGKIGQQARRTKLLVASLLSFAKQGPAMLMPVDLKTVLRTAVKLSEPVWHALKIEVNLDLQPDLPPVLGDSNQLLQVCVQVLNNVANNADQHGARSVSVAAEHKDGSAVITVTENMRAGNRPIEEDPIDPAIQPMSSLGLTACQGILQQHHGKISWVARHDHGIQIRVEIPIILPAQARLSPAGVPLMWRGQPSA